MEGAWPREREGPAEAVKPEKVGPVGGVWPRESLKDKDPAERVWSGNREKPAEQLWPEEDGPASEAWPEEEMETRELGPE